MAHVIIDGRFNGPPDSGNGGYVCGVLASALEGPTVSTLNKPPPLDRTLALDERDGRVLLRDGDVLIGSAIAEDLLLELPEAPSFEEAVEASKLFPAREQHAFPTCFVCGPRRPKDDGMNIFPGPVEGRAVVATPWTPDASMPHENKRVSDEIVWAALDCSGYFTFYPAVAVLGRLHADLQREVRVGERYVVIGWEVARQGRKLWSGSAVFDEDGNPCARASATWITLRSDQEDFEVRG